MPVTEPLTQGGAKCRDGFASRDVKSRAVIVIGLHLRRCRIGLPQKTNGNHNQHDQKMTPAIARGLLGGDWFAHVISPLLFLP